MPDVLGRRITSRSSRKRRSIRAREAISRAFGQYGKFLIQFRYDEIPHIYTNTARTAMLPDSTGSVDRASNSAEHVAADLEPDESSEYDPDADRARDDVYHTADNPACRNDRAELQLHA